VPEAQPLRDPAIMRVLAPSERAQVVAMDMRRELDKAAERITGRPGSGTARHRDSVTRILIDGYEPATA
jgi:hypothetical protein